MRKLFFKIYSAGLNNCRISLEIGVGLAHLTGSTLVPYCVEPAWSSDPLLRKGVDYSQPATVLDVFDIPVPLERTYARHRQLKPSGALSLMSAPVWDCVMRLESAPPAASKRFRAFRNGRQRVLELNPTTTSNCDLLVDVETLGMYSCFFSGSRSAQSELQQVIQKVRPKPPYRNFASRIAKGLGRFNAIHIRRGDFRYVGQSPRAHQVKANEVVGNLSSRMSRDDLLVICTDTSCERDWFLPIRQYFRNFVFLDQLILGSERWRTEFLALPHHDDTTLGLVTQLVAAQSMCFVGTLFSSFTALIQRLRGFAGKSEFLFCYNDWQSNLVRFEKCEFVPVQDGPYSWNRVLYPVYPNVFCWFREWPESFEQFSYPGASGNANGHVGPVVLRAADARVYGSRARYERTDDWNDNIGYWSDQQDYVCWDFSIEQPATYGIEARYACPDDCAGSKYSIELGDKIVFTGRVAATGDWSLFSSWQSLTRREFDPGMYTLTVRIVAMAGYAAMNLAGIRLVPIRN